MDIFEQADAFTPSRAFLQEEEEAAAPSASGNLQPAVCVWNKRIVRQLYGQRPSCDVLVVATCPTSCALLQSLPGKTLLGAVLAPAVSLAGNSLAPGDPAPGDRVCCVYALAQPSQPTQAQQAEGAAGGGGGGVLLVCCQYPVARERAAAWARAVLGQVSYGHAVFLGAMPAEQFRGQGDASQEELVFSLLTRAARQKQPAQRPAPAPLLPTGTVVGGLPAALLSHCQVRGQSAELLVLVEMVAEGRPALLEALAAALAVALRARGATEAAGALAGGGGLAAARRALGLSGGQGGMEVYA